MLREPRTKEDVLNRMTSIDFDGDLRHLSDSVQLKRLKRHVLQLYFPESQRRFNLTIHKPRPEKPKKAKVKVASGAEGETSPPPPGKKSRKVKRH